MSKTSDDSLLAYRSRLRLFCCVGYKSDLRGGIQQGCLDGGPLFTQTDTSSNQPQLFHIVSTTFPVNF